MPQTGPAAFLQADLSSEDDYPVFTFYFLEFFDPIVHHREKSNFIKLFTGPIYFFRRVEIPHAGSAQLIAGIVLPDIIRDYTGGGKNAVERIFKSLQNLIGVGVAAVLFGGGQVGQGKLIADTVFVQSINNLQGKTEGTLAVAPAVEGRVEKEAVQVS